MNQLPILLVDDSDFDRATLAKALAKKGGFEIITANSGEECLEIIQHRPVGLILMDILMPGAMGTEVLSCIRQRFNPIELPIIMVTAKSETNDVVSCLKNGANDYITKPVNFDIATSRILTHLKLAEISREMSRLKELAAFDAMITTYNHEINNPLTIALGYLSDPDVQSLPGKERLETALWRIADIVKKIRDVSDKKEAEFEAYGEHEKMLKIR